MTSTQQVFVRILAAWSATFLLWACATTQVVSQNSVARVEGVKLIALAPPIVTCIDATNNNPKEMDPKIHAYAESCIVSEINTTFSSETINVLEIGKISTADRHTLEGLRTIYKALRMHSSSLDDRHKEQISSIAETTGASHILFSRCRLYAGPGSFWNPMNGAIGSSSSKILLEGMLYSIKDDRVEWKRISQARTESIEKNDELSSLTAKLFATLKFN